MGERKKRKQKNKQRRGKGEKGKENEPDWPLSRTVDSFESSKVSESGIPEDKSKSVISSSPRSKGTTSISSESIPKEPKSELPDGSKEKSSA